MRLNLVEYFLKICETVALRGTCDRAFVGAVIVRNKQILSTGYNGSPSGTPHCDEIGHEMTSDNHCIRTVHAEANAICQAASNGVNIQGSDLYCTMVPCYACAKMIANCKIKNVVCIDDYHSSEETKKLFKELGISLTWRNICK